MTNVASARTPAQVQRPTRKRLLTVALWVVRAALAFSFASAGVQKLIGTEPMVELFDQIGIGQWLRLAIGVLEVAGAVGVLVPLLSGLAALGITALMVGATITNLLIGYPPWIPLTYLVLGAILAAAGWRRTVALPRRLRR